MNNATILFPPEDLQRDAWFRDAIPALIEAYKSGRYQNKGELPIGTRQGDSAAEECFDLTNNPGRDEERRACRWTDRRSVSTGDIVETQEGAWLCLSMGWYQIPAEPMKEPAPLQEGAQVIPVAEFKSRCQKGDFGDFTGYCSPVFQGKEDKGRLYAPSQTSCLPLWATHVVWHPNPPGTSLIVVDPALLEKQPNT